MAIRKYKPTTPGRRGSSVADFAEITRSTPEKSLLRPLPKTGGRNNQGRITTRHIGGGHKRQYRVIDFRRHDKDGVNAKVAHIEYDPNRTARIALLHYLDGTKRYIIAPNKLKQGDIVESFGLNGKPSTKSARQVLASVAPGKRVLVVLDRSDELSALSLRNLSQVHILTWDQLNAYDVVVSDDLVFTKAAFDAFVADRAEKEVSK